MKAINARSGMRRRRLQSKYIATSARMTFANMVSLIFNHYQHHRVAASGAGVPGAKRVSFATPREANEISPFSVS
jgi:hypothetical protein